MPRRRTRNLSLLLLVLGAPLLAAGLYGIAMGVATLSWPRAQATILMARVDLREGVQTAPGSDKYRGGRSETREVAAFQVRYRYHLDGLDYEADAVEPADFGLQASAAARWLGKRYAPGQRVSIAYDPHNAARAYLRPGPSSPALMFAAVGGVLVLAGIWLRPRRG